MTYAKTLSELLALRKEGVSGGSARADKTTLTVVANEGPKAVDYGPIQLRLDALSFDERRDIVRVLWDAHADGIVNLHECLYLIQSGVESEVDVRADVYVALRRASVETTNIITQVKHLDPQQLMAIGEKLNSTTIEKLLALLEAAEGL